MDDNVESERAPSKRGGLAVKILRGLATVAVIAFVITKIPLHAVGDRFTNVGISDVAVLVVVATLQMTIGATRWWRLLVRLGERPAFGAVYRDLLVGALFNTLLPTSVGGDVVRALRSSRRLSQGHRAWSSSLFERLVGMLTLAMVGAVATVFVIGKALPGRVRVVVIAVTLVLGALFFFAAAPLRFLVRLLENRLPSTFIADVRGVVADLEGPLSRGGARLETFAWSLAGFLVGIGYVSVAANALGAPGHTVALLVGIPIVSVLALAPVSIGGHGLREGLFVIVLGALGVPKDAAFGIALVALANNLTFALAGGVIVLVEPTTKRADRAR